MAILSKEEISRINLANANYLAAGREFVDMCRLFFKPGVLIYWRTRGYLQSGFVQSAFFGIAAYPDIRVQNSSTGKIVDISFYRIDWDRMISQAENYEQIKNGVGE